MLSQIFMLHSPIFVVLETFSSPCRAPAFPWKGQGRSPFHTAMGFCPGFQMLWIIAAGIAHISIYFYILTKFANKKKSQIKIRSIICLAEAQTHCSKEGLFKCPPAVSISISGGAQILLPLLKYFFFFLIYEFILHYFLFPSAFPCHCHCLGDVFLVQLWDGWSSKWEKPPWRCSGFVLFHSGSSCGSGVWAGLALAQGNLRVCVWICSDFAPKMIRN